MLARHYGAATDHGRRDGWKIAEMKEKTGMN